MTLHSTKSPGRHDRRADAGSLSIMSINAEFLWDGVAPEEGHPRIRFPWRGNRVEAERHMARIAEIVTACDPDVAVVSEVENRAALDRFNEGFLTERGYRAYIFEGDDVDTGQDVALLTRVDPDEVVFHDEAISFNGTRKGLTKNIVAKLRVGPLRLAVVGVHLIANPDDRRRRPEREAQAAVIRELTRRLRRSNFLPVVCGDFNDYDACVESIDCSDNSPISNVLRIARQMDPRRTDDDLINAARFVPKVARYTSHRDRNGNGRVDTGDLLSSIDHMLLAPELIDHVEGVDIPKHVETRFVTSHFPIVVRLRVPAT